MLNILRAKLNNPFVKEVLLAVVLFCLPFLLWVHVWFSDDIATELSIFGLNLDHGMPTDAGYFWYAFIVLVPIIYGLLFYLFGKDNIKILMILFLIVLVRDFISNVFLVYEPHIFFNYWIVSSILTVILFYYLFSSDKISRPNLTSITWRKLNLKQKWFLFLCILTLIFWFGEFWLPANKKTLDFSLFKVGTFGFSSATHFLWILSRKSILLIIPTIWFLTEVKWWKYALLSPILVTVYQLRTIFLNQTAVFDEYEILQAIPLLGLVLIVLFQRFSLDSSNFLAEITLPENIFRIFLDPTGNNMINEIFNTPIISNENIDIDFFIFLGFVLQGWCVPSFIALRRSKWLKCTGGFPPMLNKFI